MKTVLQNRLKWHFSPAYVLWLIRTCEVTTHAALIDFLGLRGPSTSSWNCRAGLERLLQEFKALGWIELLEDDCGSLRPLDLIQRMQNALHLSLLDLAQDFLRPPFPYRSREPVDSGVDLFVAMPFDDVLKPVYEHHIKAVASSLNLSVGRADDLFISSDVVHDIYRLIQESDIVLADCTGRNANVFYEIGIADMMGKPIVFTTQDEGDVPFDIRQRRHINYESAGAGPNPLTNKALSMSGPRGR